MSMRSRLALSIVCVLAVPACAGEEDEPAVDAIVQKLPKCSVTRMFFNVPVLAPAPAETCIVQPPGHETWKVQPCPPVWRIRPVDITCGNSCNRGALLCTWVDFYREVHVFTGRLGEPDVEFFTPCNNVNNCDGTVTPPGTL